jgi:hypothetical protein
VTTASGRTLQKAFRQLKILKLGGSAESSPPAAGALEALASEPRSAMQRPGLVLHVYEDRRRIRGVENYELWTRSSRRLWFARSSRWATPMSS